MNRLSYLSENKTFCEALADLESLGVQVAMHRVPGSMAYGVVKAQSNLRWWLVPLDNSDLAASGLAMFQPQLFRAQILKSIAAFLCRCGLSKLVFRRRIYLRGRPNLGKYFAKPERLEYAYFTGTDGPHRKLAAQVMNAEGAVLGFAKVTRDPIVGALLSYEADTLNEIGGLKLETGYIPRVLFAGEFRNATMLLTDTLKTSKTSGSTVFSKAHFLFLEELHSATRLNKFRSAKHAIEALAGFLLRSHPSSEWRSRLSLLSIAVAPSVSLQLGFSHGDFTPWNTFPCNGKLYVFDWEYAERESYLYLDIIHFAMNEPGMRTRSACQQLSFVNKRLGEFVKLLDLDTCRSLFIIYLLKRCAHYLEKSEAKGANEKPWEDLSEEATLLDAILLEKGSL